MFKIDFHELSFLAEACIPPVPIARHSFWIRLCDEIYFELTDDERERLYTWIKNNPKFNIQNDECLLFNERFNPENQFTIEYVFNGEKLTADCFKYYNKYHIKYNSYIIDEYIIEIQQKQCHK